MLCMLIVKACKTSEQGIFPSQSLQEQMAAYNKELVEAGVRIMAKGLHPSDRGLRLSYVEEGKPPVISHGPFEPAEVQVAGFMVLEVSSWEEAVEWAKKMPDPQGNGFGQVELRQIYE